MGLYIIVLWLMIHNNAPAWCYVLFGISVLAYILRWADKQAMADRLKDIEEGLG